eukprot:15174531-Alexandrium_andersonii.AAC.1
MAPRGQPEMSRWAQPDSNRQPSSEEKAAPQVGRTTSFVEGLGSHPPRDTPGGPKEAELAKEGRQNARKCRRRPASKHFRRT